jgi:hypothetical protein
MWIIVFVLMAFGNGDKNVSARQLKWRNTDPVPSLCWDAGAEFD